jgi:site-specific recombinase XerC
MQQLDRYVTQYLPTEVDDIKPDTPLFWYTFGQRRQGLVRRPMEGKNVWRLCKTCGRLIGYPMLKPHDLRHGVAMEVYEQHGDLEQVRGLLGHSPSHAAGGGAHRGSRRHSSTLKSARPRSSRPWSSTRRRRSTS